MKVEKYIGYGNKRTFLVVEGVDEFEKARKAANKLLKAPLRECLGKWAWTLNNELFFQKPKDNKAVTVWAFSRMRKGETEL